MMKPEEESEDAAETKRACKKPTRFGKADESHEKKTANDEEADRVACQVSPTVAAEGDYLARRNIGLERNDFFHVDTPGLPLGAHKSVIRLKGCGWEVFVREKNEKVEASVESDSAIYPNRNP
jgi:hypothetical protein